MSRGLQAKIVAFMFAVAAVALLAAIADDWRTDRANQPGSWTSAASGPDAPPPAASPAPTP
jgi:hypothetical protein